MIVAVISDSHDNLKKTEEFLNFLEKNPVDLVIHCGDVVSPFTLKLLLEGLKSDFLGVFGNNDGEVGGLLRVSGGLIGKPPVLKEIDGLKFAVMHEPLFVESLAKSGDFDFILYGHTHQVENFSLGKTKVVNPGELCGYLTGKSSFAILNTTQREVEIVKL